MYLNIERSFYNDWFLNGYYAALHRLTNQEEKKMIKILNLQDIDKIPEKTVVPYVYSLITNILNAYDSNSSIESVGAVYFMENVNDLNNYQELGLYEPIQEEIFEYICPVNEDYSEGCIVINNDFAINIIARTEYFYRSEVI